MQDLLLEGVKIYCLFCPSILLSEKKIESFCLMSENKLST